MNSETVMRDTIVIGASAGGISALRRLLSVFPADVPAAILVAQHLSPDGEQLKLDRVLSRSSALPVQFATPGMPIVPRHVYLAPPDQHLVVVDDHLDLLRGPRENRARPAIDPLFRSAALARQTRVIGAVLTGYLDDGAAGLLAVKRCGGLAFVQDPDDAEAPSMPRAAVEALGALLDGAHPIEELGRQLVRLVGTRAASAQGVPSELEHEHATLTQEADLRLATTLGEATSVTCPECGGPLRRIDDGVERYRCFTGHGYTTRALLRDQSAHLERALWAGVRSMEERGNTLRTLAQESRKAGRLHAVAALELEAKQLRDNAQTVRAMLLEPRQDDDVSVY